MRPSRKSLRRRSSTATTRAERLEPRRLLSTVLEEVYLWDYGNSTEGESWNEGGYGETGAAGSSPSATAPPAGRR